MPGKLLYTADALSRAPTQPGKDSDLQQEVESFVREVVGTLPAFTQRLNTYRQAQAADPTCKKVIEYCRTGWPQKSFPEFVLGPYWRSRDALTLHDGLLLYNQ